LYRQLASLKRINGEENMDAMTIASIAMQDDMARLASIAQNLANVATPGYKRQFDTSRSFAQHVAAAGVLDQGNGLVPGAGVSAGEGARSNAISGFTTGQFSPALDMHAGTLRSTGNALDIAVEGEGFFEVSLPNGNAYARSNSLALDARGHLQTSHGHALAGVNGDVRPNGGSVSIAPDGEVRQGERILGQIRLVRFDNPHQLQGLGQGLFAQGAAKLADGRKGDSAVGVLRSAVQENSNVNSAQEMIHLTETVRHFETMQKVMQGYGDVMEQALRKLGEF
jgi:flagellar basal body rod protein FlgG